MTDGRAAFVVKRLAAFAIDWCVIVVWGTIVFAGAWLLNGGLPSDPGGPWRAQAIAFVAMTLPVLLYFAICESRPAGATLGKRLLGLRVVAVDPRRVSAQPGAAAAAAAAASADAPARAARAAFGRTLARNAVKLAPWELGHTVAQQAVYSGETGMSPGWILVSVVAMAGPIAWAVGLVWTGRTPYDALVGTAVEVRRRAASSWTSR